MKKYKSLKFELHYKTNNLDEFIDLRKKLRACLQIVRNNLIKNNKIKIHFRRTGDIEKGSAKETIICIFLNLSTSFVGNYLYDSVKSELKHVVENDTNHLIEVTDVGGFWRQ